MFFYLQTYLTNQFGSNEFGLNCRKNIFSDISEHVKAYAERYTKLADAITTSIEEVNDDNPYEPFIVKKG